MFYLLGIIAIVLPTFFIVLLSRNFKGMFGILLTIASYILFLIIIASALILYKENIAAVETIKVDKIDDAKVLFNSKILSQVLKFVLWLFVLVKTIYLVSIYVIRKDNGQNIINNTSLMYVVLDIVVVPLIAVLMGGEVSFVLPLVLDLIGTGLFLLSESFSFALEEKDYAVSY